MAQGIPPAAAMASYRRSRLPFDRLQTLKMPRRPFACIALCRSGVHASGTPAGKSHHKATAMAQGIPPAAAMASYRRSRLPFDRLQTLRRHASQAVCLAHSSNGSVKRLKLIGVVQGCRLTFLGHARRQKPPQGHSNGSRHPPGRSNGFFVQGCRLTGFKRPRPFAA